MHQNEIMSGEPIEMSEDSKRNSRLQVSPLGDIQSQFKLIFPDHNKENENTSCEEGQTVIAMGNGLGVVRVANECDLWLSGNETYKSTLESVMSAVRAGCDVVNHSWVPGGRFFEQIDEPKQQKISYDKASLGRNGLGMSLVFAAGNERRLDLDTASRNTTKHENVIALAAADSSRLELEDSDGGNDTFNAASLTGDAVIDLKAGSFYFARGTPGSIAPGTVIETVIVQGTRAMTPFMSI
jgi:hypothetical protein